SGPMVGRGLVYPSPRSGEGGDARASGRRRVGCFFVLFFKWTSRRLLEPPPPPLRGGPSPGGSLEGGGITRATSLRGPTPCPSGAPERSGSASRRRCRAVAAPFRRSSSSRRRAPPRAARPRC